MISQGSSQQPHPFQQLGPLGLVILLHVAAFYALQSGLSQPIKQPAPREIIATLIAAQPAATPKAAPPAPQPEPQPAPPKPQAQPKPERPKPQPAPKPVKQAPKAEPTPEPTPNSISKPAEPAPAPAAPPAAAAPTPNAPATSGASSGQTGPVQPKTVTSGLEYISQPAREYPAISRRLGEEGTTTLRILVSEKGRVEQVDIRKSSGVPRLDEAARRWAERVVFKPYMENGRAIPVYAILPISFNLDN